VKRLALILVVLTATLAFALSAPAEVKKAKGSIELADAAGDAKKDFDVTKLAIVSDGKQLKFAVTLKEPPGNYADTVIEVFFDTDNNPKTGAKLQLSDGKMGVGYDYTSKLKSCIEYDNGVTVCSGSAKAKVKERFGVMGLHRYKGKTESGKEEIVTRLVGKKKKAKRIPIKGKVVQGVLDYADLKVKSGQTIRILVWEFGAQRKEKAMFPEILLTLN
jgi:hypothetical protein